MELPEIYSLKITELLILVSFFEKVKLKTFFCVFHFASTGLIHSYE